MRTLVATLDAAKDGSERAGGKAFEEALVESRPRLFRVALLMVGSRDDAEDLTQRALLRGLMAKGRFRGASSVYTWLYRILINLSKDLYKSRSRADRWLLRDGSDVDAAQEGPSTQEHLERCEADGEVRSALAALEPPMREILVLRHYEEMSYEQMAEVLSIPLGTVRSRLSAARTRLRRALEDGRS